MATSTSSSTATCTTGTPARRTGSPGHEHYAKGWIECFHAYQSLGPPETHWTIEHFYKASEEDLMKDVFEDGYVDKAIFQPTYLKEWYATGFNTAEQNAALAAKHPDKFIVNGRWDPREGDAGIKQLEEDVARVRPQGRQAVHRRVARGVARLDAEGPGGLPVPGEEPGTGHQEHPRAQGPDHLAAGQGRLRRLRRRSCGDGLPGAELHRRARRPAADRGLLLHGDPGAQRLRRVSPWSSGA